MACAQLASNGYRLAKSWQYSDAGLPEPPADTTRVSPRAGAVSPGRDCTGLAYPLQSLVAVIYCRTIKHGRVW